MDLLASGAWITDWSCGLLPEVVLASVVHVIGLGAIELGVERSLKRAKRFRYAIWRRLPASGGATVLSATALRTTKNSCLGGSLSHQLNSSRQTLGDAVFNWCDDLRPCKPPSF